MEDLIVDRMMGVPVGLNVAVHQAHVIALGHTEDRIVGRMMGVSVGLSVVVDRAQVLRPHRRHHQVVAPRIA